MAATFVASKNTGDRMFGAPGGVSELHGTFNIGVYVADGVTVSAASPFGATTLHNAIFGISANGKVVYELNAAKTKVLARNRAGSQIANGVDLSASGYSCLATIFVTE